MDKIQNFLLDYVHSIDDGKYDTWPDYFTEDAVYKITTRHNVENNYPMGIVYCCGKPMLNDRIKAMLTANVFEPHWYSHIVGQPVIQFKDTYYDVRSNFSVFRTMENGKQDLFATGKYLDKVVHVDGEPLFKQRIVVLDSKCIDTLLVIPL